MTGMFDKNHLPSIFLANIQSIANKLDETEIVVSLSKINVIILTETWLTENTKNTVSFTDYIPYHKTRDICDRASGGVAILVSHDMIPTRLVKLESDHLECLWLACRPRWLPRVASVIVLCAVYYPGSNSLYAPNQDELIDHIIVNTQYLKNKYSNPLFFILGDFNDLCIERLLKICQFTQKVKVPTRGRKTLDYIISNACDNLYNEPYTIPKIGKGDHFPVIYEPKMYKPPPQKKNKVNKRNFLRSAVLEFGNWITHHNWSEVLEEDDPDLKVCAYIKTIWYQIEKYFPLQTVTLSNTDKPWITPDIKKKIQLRRKAHLQKNFEVRDQLHKAIKKMCFELRLKYRKNNIHLLNNLESKNWYRQINTIIYPDKCSHNKIINIPELAGLDLCDIVGMINNKFAETCRQYAPLDLSSLPAYLPQNNTHIEIDELKTYNSLKKVASKSPGPWDIPPRLLEEFSPELATPICDIVKACLKKGVFPKMWKKAKVVPIPKSNPPESLADLRPISLTPAPAKILEKIIATELSKQIETKLDTCQFGNTKGSSATHYLIKLTDMAYAGAEEGKATTAITIDYPKAFDYIDHNILIKKLINLGVSANIVKLLISFLSNRSHCTKVGNETSSYKEISCGVPQGTINGPKLFVIMINGDTDNDIINLKFVDDKTIALTHSGDPTEALQERLNAIEKQAKDNAMCINAKKCHTITFNFSSANVSPSSLILDNNIIKREKSIKLLGVIISDDLKWTQNTISIYKKVNSMLFILSKIKSFGATRDDLIKGLAKGLFSSPKVSNLMDNIIKVMIQVCFMNKYS